jgi:hypothetical protein
MADEVDINAMSRAVAWLEKYNVGKGLKGSKFPRKSFVGRGIQTRNIHEKYYVDICHLNKNSLAVKYQSTKKLVQPPQQITESQKDSIMAIMQGTYTKKAYDKLRSEEKELVHDFAVLTRAKNVNFITEIDSLRIKFDVLVGEVEAGNNSPEVYRMLKLATEKLYKAKGLTKLEYLELINQLK